MWSLYLSYCEAGFAERRIGDVMVLLAKPRHRSAPWADVRSADDSASVPLAAIDS